MYVHYTWGLLGQKLFIIIPCASSSSYIRIFPCVFSSPLYASIWLKFWPSWVAWLPCLCPTFPLVRLGHKGSTSVIVTAGLSGCVPQTGWSRKLAFLREYSVGGWKILFALTLLWTPRNYTHCDFYITIRTCLLMHAHLGKGTLNETILPGRCFLQSQCNIT